MLPIAFAIFLLNSVAHADFLVRTVTVNNVNYDDFSLLCAEGIPLLMEDHKPRKCQPRPWRPEQKCPIGFWCHEGDDDTTYYCCPRSRKVSNLCHLPAATGFGKQLMRRFYYDWKSDGCHELQYTGIGGNENSFITYEACEDYCRGVGEPMSTSFGGLSASNKTKQTAESKKNPEKEKAVKNQPPTISFTISSTTSPEVPSSQRSIDIPKTTSELPTRKATKPNFAKQKSTIRTTPQTTSTVTTTTTTPITTTTTVNTENIEIVGNPCTLPPGRGFSGGVARKMWYFDMSTMSCVQFTYQGSGGNFNKFDTSDICMSVCGIGKPTRKSCDLSPSLGTGPFKIPRYYFDSRSQKCELFYYTGEDGNDNRFFKKHKCERLCLGKQTKKKEETKSPEISVTSAPTRIVVNFVSSEATAIPFTLEQTRGWTNTFEETENEFYSTEPTVVLPRFDLLETRKPVHEIEQIMETTQATRKTQSTATSTAATPPFVETTVVQSVEPSTFPTLVYVPKEEVATLDPYSQPNQPMDELFSQLMTAQVPLNRVEPTGAPTIIEKSQIGPAPDTHIPLGNFPWETTPPGFVMPAGLDPSLSLIYIQSPEQLEAMVKAMAVPPSHHIHGIPPPVATESPTTPSPPEIQRPVGPMTSLPVYQRQWGVQPPPAAPQPAPQPNVYVPIVSAGPSDTIPVQPVLPFPSLPSAVPVSSGNSAPVVQQPKGPQPTVNYLQVTPLPTTGAYPSYGNNPIHQQIVVNSTYAPQPVQISANVVNQNLQGPYVLPNPVQPVPQVMISQVPTDTFTVNVSQIEQPPGIDVRVDVVTDLPPIPDISMSFVGPAVNSPCQLPVVDLDVVIMCESADVICPAGSFCQIGHGQSICCPSVGGSPCHQTLERGVGSAQLTRWYFNPLTGHCETFLFAGFQGNENNFRSFSECQTSCSATNPCENGEPVSPLNPEQRCSAENRCPSDVMCHSIGTTSACCAPKFSSNTTPKPTINNDPCRQPIAEGQGGESQHRWAFDQNAGRCVSFIYQGRHGNLNNFLTKSDCQTICGAPPTVPSRCLQPGISGNGDQYLARYFYSPEYRQCLHFIYSGSGGNENNFVTQQDCLETCVANGIKFSSLVSDVAPFAFSFIPAPVCPQGSPLKNSSGQTTSCSPTGQCPSGFVCTSTGPLKFCCPSPENFCLEPRPAVSVCAGSGRPVEQIRFTYDPLSDKCVRFSYKDCHATVLQSLNLFSSQPQCSRLCCNQGFNLLYRRRKKLLMMNDSPVIEKSKRT